MVFHFMCMSKKLWVFVVFMMINTLLLFYDIIPICNCSYNFYWSIYHDRLNSFCDKSWFYLSHQNFGDNLCFFIFAINLLPFVTPYSNISILFVSLSSGFTSLPLSLFCSSCFTILSTLCLGSSFIYYGNTIFKMLFLSLARFHWT